MLRLKKYSFARLSRILDYFVYLPAYSPLPSRLSLWACSSNKFPLLRSFSFRDRKVCLCATHFVFFLPFSLGLAFCIGKRAGAIQKWQPGHGAESSPHQPAWRQHATIGISTVTIDYSRPLAGTREVWGKTVPYGKVWRSGANENTTITFSDEVSVEGQAARGRHLRPAHGSRQGSVDRHLLQELHILGQLQLRRKEDALRVTVKPATDQNFDTLTYNLRRREADSAVATLRWKKVAVPFPRFRGRESRYPQEHSQPVCAASAALPGPAMRRSRELVPRQQLQLEEALVGRTLPSRTKIALKIWKRSRASSTPWAERPKPPRRSPPRSPRHRHAALRFYARACQRSGDANVRLSFTRKSPSAIPTTG